MEELTDKIVVLVEKTLLKNNIELYSEDSEILRIVLDEILVRYKEINYGSE